VPGQPGTVTICCRWCGEVETWSEREVEQRHVWCRRALRQGIACPQCGELLDGQRPPAQHHGHDDDAPTPEPSTRRLALLPSF
jgi:hypothetical protein